LFALLPGAGRAQTRIEWQAQAVVAVLADRFVGAGPGLGVRTAGRLRLGMVLSLGDLEGAAAGRAEALASFHLDPFRPRGITAYAGGGVAVAATRDAAREYVVVVLGMEANPAGRAGWFIESGVGGGLRLSGGVRLRAPRFASR
jgi:hypothetical protein